MAEKKTKNIYEKMLEVMKAIEYLQKDDAVAFGTTMYKAISEEKVTSTVRAEFIKQGLVVYPTKQEVGKEGNITSVNTEYVLVNTENPEEKIVLASSGQGADTQDKGVGKAMTYAYKYMLLRTFAIPTGEDPDKISSAELDAMEKNAKESKKYKAGVEGKKQKLKELLEETNSDVPKFLEWCTSKFERGITSVDAMYDLELDEAIKTVQAKKGA